LRSETELLLRELRKPEKPAASSRAAKDEIRTCDEDLYQALKALRRTLADQQGVPAYVIFHDRTLQEMARLRPKRLDDLRLVSGVGEQKLKHYGEVFLKIINDHALPDLLNNRLSDTVNATLYLHMQGYSLDVIATKRDLKPSTIYGHFAEAALAGLLDITTILPLDDTEYQTIVNAMELLDTGSSGKLKPVYEALEGAYDYDILKCVLAGLATDEITA
jgi:ATP-dependent DNA helicase RecQ